MKTGKCISSVAVGCQRTVITVPFSCDFLPVEESSRTHAKNKERKAEYKESALSECTCRLTSAGEELFRFS